MDLNDRIRREQQATAARGQAERACQQSEQAAEQHERIVKGQLGQHFVVWMRQSGIDLKLLGWREEKRMFGKPRRVPVRYGWELYHHDCRDRDCRRLTEYHTVTVDTDGGIAAPNCIGISPFTSQMFQDMVVRYATEHKISTPWPR